MSTLELAGHLLETEPARPRTRQRIGGGEPQLVCSFRPLPERLIAFTGCFLPVGGRAGTVVGCLCPIRRRSRPVAPRPGQDVLPARILVVLQIVQTSELITASRATIAERRSPIALVSCLQPRCSTLVTDCRHDDTVASGPLPRESAPLMRALVAAGREILVGSLLILIRTSLIAFTGALVVIRPRLILITRGLVAIGPRLILVALVLAPIICRAVSGRVVDVGREVGAAGRTAGNLCHLAAGWTPQAPCHQFPFPS